MQDFSGSPNKHTVLVASASLAQARIYGPLLTNVLVPTAANIGTQTVSTRVPSSSVGEPAVHVQGQEPLTASLLAAAPPQEQKQMIGERLYPLIHVMHPSLAGKITGMLLEIDNSELLLLLESPDSLRSKVGQISAQTNPSPRG
uniref:Uncharacterized protein n=1 Tax=Geospiza parvula TaxID=87175 RepID=A0A8C3N104_GEOPR